MTARGDRRQRGPARTLPAPRLIKPACLVGDDGGLVQLEQACPRRPHETKRSRVQPSRQQNHLSYPVLAGSTLQEVVEESGANGLEHRGTFALLG